MSNPKHNMAGSPEYNSWCSMKQRCYNKNHISYSLYGDRGIRVCERWRISFSSFIEDMGKRPENKTLDRINSNGNYEPGNCRWATKSEQLQNRRVFKNSISGRKGIYWNEVRQCWQVRRTMDGKREYIGSTKSLDEAEKLYFSIFP